MDPLNTGLTTGQGVVGRHELTLLYQSRDAQDFSVRFQAWTGHSVCQVVDRLVVAAAPKAIFLTGSLPLGMANSASDIDFVVLVDDKLALRASEAGRSVNSSQHLAFFNESDVLRVGLFNTMMKGITVEVTVVLTPGLRRIQDRLRSRGPELSESEMMIVGRLATGWRLWQSDGYLERQGLILNDPAFDLYCCTRNFTFALIYRRKAAAALEALDIPSALHFGRLSIGMVYISYFASEGFSYLGPKWLAQLGQARGAPETLKRNPLLKPNIYLLFPAYTERLADAEQYLRATSEFLTTMRRVIERKMPFRIAFSACAQISGKE